MEFKTVLRENHLTQKLIYPHTPEQNRIVERANKTMRESLVPVILTGFEQAKSELSTIIDHYNNKRRHSSLHYLTPVQYYRGDPDVLLAVREAKINMARVIRKERNMERKKGGERSRTFSCSRSLMAVLILWENSCSYVLQSLFFSGYSSLYFFPRISLISSSLYFMSSELISGIRYVYI